MQNPFRYFNSSPGTERKAEAVATALHDFILTPELNFLSLEILANRLLGTAMYTKLNCWLLSGNHAHIRHQNVRYGSEADLN